MGDILSHSRLASELRCEFQADARYVQGYRPLLEERAPTLGRFFHAGIAAGWLASAPLDFMGAAAEAVSELFLDGQQKIIDRIEDEKIMEEQIAQLVEVMETSLLLIERVREQMDGWEVVHLDNTPLIEAHLVVGGVPGWDGFQAYIDAVLMDPNGVSWLIDWKVRESIPEESAVDIDLQQSIYQHMLLQSRVPIRGAAIINVKASVPKIPALNKPDKFGKQAVSRADCATTWDVYKATVEQVGGNPDDYIEMKEKLDRKIWMRIDRAVRSGGEVANIWKEVVLPQALRIRHRMKWDVALRNYGSFFCSNCWFKEPCLEGLRGRDPSDILRLNFRNVIEDRANEEPEFEYTPPSVVGETPGSEDQPASLWGERGGEDDIRGDSPGSPSDGRRLVRGYRGRPIVSDG